MQDHKARLFGGGIRPPTSEIRRLSSPLKFCKVAGCPQKTRGAFCPAHLVDMVGTVRGVR